WLDRTRSPLLRKSSPECRVTASEKHTHARARAQKGRRKIRRPHAITSVAEDGKLSASFSPSSFLKTNFGCIGVREEESRLRFPSLTFSLHVNRLGTETLLSRSRADLTRINRRTLYLSVCVSE
ncbi:hypothetical protein AMELA_G00002100, partial [Ameiurus melas]